MAVIGHKKMKEQIEVAIASAKKRNSAPPHMLFSGHPGCGKTSMAKEVAKLLGTDFISVVPEELKNQKVILDLLESLNYTGYDEKGNRISTIKPSIIFLDECHRLPMYGQEKLGIAMENFTMETGQANRFYWLPYFTIIGATTLTGELSKPFLDRFKLNFFFEPYTLKDSQLILKYHAKKLDLIASPKAYRDIAIRGRGVPRIMLRYLERCRDMMYAIGSKIITSGLTKHTFENMGIDEMGFNKIELKILKALYNADKPVGLETLSVITGESSKTIKNDIETYLIREEYIGRTGSGRSITPKGRLYLEEQGYVGTKQGRATISAEYIRT
jgi:Holliday junction DNA helicase RuvB